MRIKRVLVREKEKKFNFYCDTFSSSDTTEGTEKTENNKHFTTFFIFILEESEHPVCCVSMELFSHFSLILSLSSQISLMLRDIAIHVTQATDKIFFFIHLMFYRPEDW